MSVTHQGYVNLESLTTLPDSVKFNNQGDVDLENLTHLPESVQFNNLGWVNLASLDHKSINYLGQRRNIRFIDEKTMILMSTKTRGSDIIMQMKYFQGVPFEDMDACFIAQIGDYYAHGETEEQALRDCRLKVLGEIDEGLIASTAKESINRGWVNFVAWAHSVWSGLPSRLRAPPQRYN